MNRIMGIYRGDEKIGCEVLMGKEAKHLSPFKDLLLLHTNILKAHREKEGLLLFLNLNILTLIKKGYEVGRLLKEGETDYLIVVEVDIEEVIHYREDFKRVKDYVLLLSFDHVRLTPEHLEIVKTFSPTYIKMSIGEVGCLSKEGITVVRDMVQEVAQTSLVFTHVETQEDFKKLPEDSLWMGFYEKEKGKQRIHTR